MIIEDEPIARKILEEYIQHVRTVIIRLKEKNLSLKLSKYEFYKYKVIFLGYIIFKEDLKLDLKKIEFVRD